ncbi:MAG: hypothetical protein LWY06_09040 [Firmicutes bacterium]|nr:hypothetical protein [Bacillota bacterium]
MKYNNQYYLKKAVEKADKAILTALSGHTLLDSGFFTKTHAELVKYFYTLETNPEKILGDE